MDDNEGNAETNWREKLISIFEQMHYNKDLSRHSYVQGSNSGPS